MIGVVSYGTACIAFLLLGAILAVSWQGRSQGVRLIAAVAMTSVWAAGVVWQILQPATLPVLVVFSLEILRDGAWIIVLTGLGQGSLPRPVAAGSHVAWLGLLLTAWVLAALQKSSFALVGPERLLVPGGIAMAILALVLLERIFRGAGPATRRALVYFVIGLGGVFLYDLIIYSAAVLGGGMYAGPWLARGIVTAMLVPFIAIAARRNANWSLEVFVSRDAVYYSTSLMVVTLYLLLMAAGTYMLRYLGESPGNFAEIVFFAMGLGLLAALAGSSTLRRKLKVFLAKHFYRHKYEYREEWLRFIATLSEERTDEDASVRGLRAVGQIISSPGAALLLRDESRYGCRIKASWPGKQLVPESAVELGTNGELLHLLGRREWIVDLAEYRRSRNTYGLLVLPDWLDAGAQWRLIVPVQLGNQLLGLMLLQEPPGGFELTFEDRDLLKTVARHVATHLAQQESEARLAEARQFEAYNRLSAFLMHDLKNAVAQLNLVVSNGARHRVNLEFIDDAIDTVANAASRITRLIEQLDQAKSEVATETLGLEALARTAVEQAQGRDPRPELVCDGATVRIAANRERLIGVLEHVIRNAQDATPANGRIIVRVSNRGESVAIEVTDSGHGMNAEFIRERLFRPFDSTKGSKGMGIGAYQAREYARSIGGDVEVESTPGQGTTFRIVLPLAGRAIAA
jgi:putative PEP-CTERM system histidine kinase